jgi:hypothetical protein
LDQNFGATRSNISGHLESDAHQFRLFESLFEFLVHPGIQFRHRLGLVPHPKVIDVLLATLSSQLRLAIATESVPPNSLLVEVHRFEPGGEPAGFEIVVQTWRTVSGLE